MPLEPSDDEDAVNYDRVSTDLGEQGNKISITFTTHYLST